MTARILVVDDSASNVKLLQAMLALEYMHVVVARDGPEALIRIAEHQPDLVLLDGMMPGMDGFEVCRRVRSAPETAHVPIVMVTTLDQPADRIAAFEAGADDFLSKPVNRFGLLARVRNLTRAKIMFDLLRLREPVSEPARRSGVSADRARILVIGDRREIADHVRLALGGQHRVYIERDADDALLLVRRAEFDLIAVDLMHGEDGLRACGQLRALEETRRTPLLGIAPGLDVEIEVRAFDLGASGIAALPVHTSELRARVASLVRRKRYWDRLLESPIRSLDDCIDPLTSMRDRRYLERHLGPLVSRNVERGRPVSLLFIDVDRLQNVNDAYDPDVGDEVLREIARRISASLRGLDLSCRFGGEEFVAALPGVDGAIARRIGERVRRRVSERPFPIATERGPLEVTISIGLATTKGSHDTADALLERADSALLQAKKEGRNRVFACA
jgi:two-component system cell cycle response regulator